MNQLNPDLEANLIDEDYYYDDSRYHRDIPHPEQVDNRFINFFFIISNRSKLSNKILSELEQMTLMLPHDLTSLL